jgi:hypothetical protein
MRMPTFIKESEINEPCKCGSRDFEIEDDFIAEDKKRKCVKCGDVKTIANINS